MASEPRPRLNVTSLSQYVRYQNCDRYLRFRLRSDEERALRQKWEVTIQPLTPLLKDEGYRFESQVEEEIRADFPNVVVLEGSDAELTEEWLRRVRKPVVLLQPPLAGTIGRYEFNGVGDVLHLRRQRNGTVSAHIADIKASRTKRTEHRIQIAAYAYLLRQMAERAGVEIQEISGSVLHMQEDGSLPRLDLDDAFELDPYLTILDHLIVDEDSTVNRIAGASFDDAFYHLGYQCDGCLYNALCMYDSAERQDLSLVPHLSPTEKRTLQAHGVETLEELALLMDFPTEGYEMIPAAEHRDRYEDLVNVWPVGTNLPILVQRARRAARRFDPSMRSKTVLYAEGNYGSLPADDEHPGLIKIFFDAQRDYLQDRVYMAAALVHGPGGRRIVVECSDEPPSDASEERLLVDWVRGVLRAMAEVADREKAPVHLYCYNSYDQRSLLEALKRHISAVSELPGFFDLMTQSPALSQPIISFLARELEERRNLGLVCLSLHDSARMLGFDWTHDGVEYYELFRARLFDNRRTVLRLDDGAIRNLKPEEREAGVDSFPIESASRFNSQIPLEYAYAAWKRLPEPDDPREKGVLTPFRQISRDDLLGFAAHRVRALAHIEDSFRYKARYLKKEPLDLSQIEQAAQGETSLAQSLREFLFIEHHTALQNKLQIYSLPIDRRMQTGLALLLRYQGPGAEPERERFAVACAEVGLDLELTMQGLRLKEGAWVLLNPTDVKLSANQMKHGCLATIEAVGPDWVELSLKRISFGKSSRFHYYHKRQMEFEEGALYTLDEMADDMNGDKALEALGHTESNALYGWLEKKPEARDRHDLEEASRHFLSYVDQIEQPNRLTKPQRRIVGAHLGDPLLLVQGPPGTGKSHTIGWAVIGRILLAASQDRPLRIAVTCKTHNAVNIVLESIAKKWNKLAGLRLPGLIRGDLPYVPIIKLVNDPADELPSGVQPLSTYRAPARVLEQTLDLPYTVIGGTPGGLFNLARYREVGNEGQRKKVDWATKPFDLLVIDEASQMSIPEALLAGAFLHSDGSMLVVGDHRQMPPIVAHAWESEEKRSVVEAEPYRSLFEYLLDLGFPRESLDQSFRLHTTIADFLNQNIYVHDGIRFFSKRRDLLDASLTDDPYARLVMAPDFPIVVLEHGEAASHQFNELELSLVDPLIRSVQEMRLDGLDGVGVVVPHRAQKALLRAKYPELARVDAIDTVERFQGGERDVIIVSATASDPDYVLAEAGFLLNLNRLNVALSRPRKKLIVVASRSVVRLLTSDLEIFESAVVWKDLFFRYADRPLWSGQVGGFPLTIRGHGVGRG